jgi:hypothetical protein
LVLRYSDGGLEVAMSAIKGMKDLDGCVIMPVSGYNAAVLYMSLVGIRTLRASTCAEILIVGNNTPDLKVRYDLERECGLLGCRWSYMDGPFNITRTFNWGFDNTNGAYMANAGADLIAYPGWYHNLIEVWEQNPQFFTLSPFSFHRELPDFHPYVTHPEARVMERHIHCNAVCVFKRKDGWRYDELSEWECDSDLHHHILKNGLREGYVLNSRVDHMITGFRSNIDMLAPEMYARSYHESSEYVWKKWGLARPA